MREGDVFHRLTVVGFGERLVRRRDGTTTTRPGVRCRCDCGNEHDADPSKLRRGVLFSCGCYARERWSQRFKTPEIDALRRANIKHGCSRVAGHTSEYRSWTSMKSRCSNPNDSTYRLYGGRGITVCDRWRESFEVFLADMGPKPTPKHTLDRLDPDGNYEPGNCRWATALEQGQTRRTSTRCLLNGELMSISEVCRRLSISRNRAYDRMRLSGWGIWAFYGSTDTTMTTRGRKRAPKP